MKNFNKYFKYVFIVSIFLISFCITILIYYAFLGKIYLNVNKKNEQEIIKLLENEEIKINGKLKKIGKMQGLGDWYLYLEYYNGSKDEELLDDSEAVELYSYISSNGYCGGNKGKIATYLLKSSFIIIPIYITYMICYKIKMKTDEAIENDKR